MTPPDSYSLPDANAPSTTALRATLLRQTRELASVQEQFFTEQADTIVTCCRAMAQAFHLGGRLLVMGNGGSCCDAMHMAVECTHPIIAKRPPLPAISLTTDTALLTAVGNDRDFSFAYVEQLRLLAREGDMAMAFSTSGNSRNLVRAMQVARELKVL